MGKLEGGLEQASGGDTITSTSTGAEQPKSYSHVLQDVIRRHFKAKQAFFRRVALGEKPGYPRYKTTARYRSLTFPDQAGWKLEAKHLVLTGPGRMRIRLHRPLQGTIHVPHHQAGRGPVVRPLLL